ncbi:hypothetical protein HOI26_01400 [Candidatus Woesearchaeota archaeon]|jgi:hypothetical protein|nr:hypothetical protein [Candidatus Woesearchaeota archaeon]MBT5739731.1 hypothetical protein [Candidatus Woesearchaeota archaeon]
MNLGKKGQSSFLNLVDLSIGFFIFIVFFFLVIFLLWTGTSEAESVSLDGVSSFKQTESAINNLRIQMQNGADLTGLNLTEEIASSRLLDGKVINSCYDYFSEEDCVNDVLSLVTDQPLLSCEWITDRCIILSVGVFI